MKKIIVILLFATLAVTSMAQEYYPFPDSSARWFEGVSWFEIGWAQSYFLAGDTIVSNVTYSKVYRTGTEPIIDTSETEYVGCIREDSLKRIYYLPNQDHEMACTVADSTEILVYDFTAQIGDTITYLIDTLLNGDPRYLHNIILDIDYIEIEGELRRQLFVQSYEPIPPSGGYVREGWWIEGIGSTMSLFSPILYQTCGPGAFYTELYCFYSINTFFGPGIGNIEDCFYVPVEEQEYITDNIRAFPNPFTTSTTLSYTLNKPSIVTISIFNPQGQLIERIEQKQPKGEQKIEWNAEGLPAGMYYFRIQAGGRVGGRKMVKFY